MRIMVISKFCWQKIATFNSPFGRYCFKRMPFGIKSAQEVFQKRMSQLLGDLPGVETDIDDILWGTNQIEHDRFRSWQGVFVQ